MVSELTRADTYVCPDIDGFFVGQSVGLPSKLTEKKGLALEKT
jgi:hypothetical protein